MQFAATVTPLAEDVVGDVRPLLLVLLGAVGFVLLIACANIANLFLSRGERRQHEFGVRTALGASRWRLVAATMAESALVAVAGGAIGVVCANAATGLLLALRPAGLPRLDTISFDWPVLLFLAAVVAVVAMLVGLRAGAARLARHRGHGARRRQGRDRRAEPSPHARRAGGERGGAVDRAADRRGPGDAKLLEPAVGGPGLPHRPRADGVDHAADCPPIPIPSARRGSSSPCSTGCARNPASPPPAR